MNAKGSLAIVWAVKLTPVLSVWTHTAAISVNVRKAIDYLQGITHALITMNVLKTQMFAIKNVRISREDIDVYVLKDIPKTWKQKNVFVST